MSDVRSKLSRRRLRRAFYVVLLAALIGLIVSFWSWVDAQARAVVVISSVLDTPALTPAVRATSGEPRLSDTRVAGYPSLVAKPAGEGPWPAIFVVNGTVPEGRELPAVRNLAEGFARAGYLAVVPDLPGLREDRITPLTVNATTEAAREISARPDTENGEVAMVGVSTGATLALLAAEDPSLKGKVSLVAGVAPFSNMETVLSVATTAHYRQPDGKLVRYEATPFLSYVVARSLVAALPPGEDRQTLSAEISGVGRENPDPLHDLRSRRTYDLGPEAKSVVRLLANRDPKRFEDLYATLPDGVRHDLEELRRSPEKRSSAPLSSSPRVPATSIFLPRSHSPQACSSAAQGHRHARSRPCRTQRLSTRHPGLRGLRRLRGTRPAHRPKLAIASCGAMLAARRGS